MSFAEPEPAGFDIPDDLIARVKPELRPGERLIWAGRPIRRPPLSLASLGWAVGCLGLLYVIAGAFLVIFYAVLAKDHVTADTFAIFMTIFGCLAVLATIAWSVGGIVNLLERQRVTREMYALTEIHER